MQIFVIVPCKNEEGNIHSIVEDFRNFRRDQDRLILVEGGSTDNTAKVCQEYAKSDPKIQYLNQLGRGKFGAVKTAMTNLAERKADGIVAIWDADHSIVYQDVLRAIKAVENTSSYLYTERIGAKIEKGAMPRLNNLGNRVIAVLASFIFKIRIHDALSGTKVFPIEMFKYPRNADIDDFLIRDTYGDLSYFLLAKVNKYPMRGLKVDYFARKYGASGLARFENGIELIQSLFKARRIISESENI